MKIVATSNFNIESMAEWLVADNVKEPYASEICEFMNIKHGGMYATYHFKVFPDDYKLWRGMEELV